MPHLNELRAFESAARLGSFSYAASELFVTPEDLVRRQLEKRFLSIKTAKPIGPKSLLDADVKKLLNNDR